MAGHPVCVGVVGCGTIAQFHFQAVKELGEDTAALVALCDLREERLEQAHQLWPAARLAREVRELMAPGDLDLVIVGTMPHTHASIAIAALEGGAHVLCEKPFAMNAAEGQAILDAAAGAGRQFQLCTNLRYLPTSQYLRELVNSGSVGIPLLCKIWSYHLNPPWWAPHYHRSTSGGGVLASTLIHALDQAIWVSGCPNPLSVQAVARRVFPEKRGPLATGEVRARYDVEDLLSGFVRFDNGMVATLEGNWCYERGDSIGFELVTTQATLSSVPFGVLVDKGGKVVDQTPELAGAEFARRAFWHLTDQVEPGKPLEVADTELIAAWTRSICAQDADAIQRLIQGRPWELQNRRQLLNLQRLIDGCYESAQLGRPVELAPA
ncbi:MAG: Gfo/Idh/MocA family oxidoreductase [Candidatus Latescibacteria bacterium]|nr:Gfo/Idh/MocA family oxidoreductase [Candidatus Latescibacterota bacterium]